MSISGDGKLNREENNSSESFEEKLSRLTKERQKQRQEYYAKKGRRFRAPDSEHLTVYKARAALQSAAEKKLRGEGIVHRVWRLIRGIARKRREISGKPWYTSDRKRSEYVSVVRDTLKPLWNAWTDAAEALWSFLSRLGSDFRDCLLFIADIFIALWYYGGSVLYFLSDRVWDIRLWLERHKRHLFGGFVIAVSTAATAAVVVSSMVTYEYSYYGKVLGVTKSKETVYATIASLGDKLSEAAGANVSLDVERDIEFKKLYGFGQKVDSSEDILSTLTYMKDLQVRAVAISINGSRKVILEDEETAKLVLKAIKNDYQSFEYKTETVSTEFVEEVTLDEVGTTLGDIWNAVDAKNYLETGSVKAVSDVKVPQLSVRTVEHVSYTEEIPYGTDYRENSRMYQDEEELISEGIPGENAVVTEVEKINGEEVASKVISTVQIKSPVNEVKYKGTMAIPERTGTGTFAYPVYTYTISSYYGMRWGRMHNGVDFADPTGTKIHASDGGTVTFAGWKGSYGYMVIIDHGGLYETYYAHCSKILVSAGDAIYQGQVIALVGSTGNSTGPHLHFEVRYNGRAGNPLDYLDASAAAEETEE